MVTINISNKTAYVLVGVLAVIVVAGLAIAWGGTPEVHGHDVGEIKGGGGVGTVILDVQGPITPESCDGGTCYCVEIPVEQCDEQGCLLKINYYYYTNRPYIYSGDLYYNSDAYYEVTFAYMGGAQYAWSLSNGGYDQSPFSGANIIWFGDYKWNSGAGGVPSGADDPHVCAYTDKFSILLIKY